MMKRNKEGLIRVILLGAMEILFFISLISEEVNNYVHPRMNKYIIFCVVLIGVMIIFEVPQLVKINHRNHMKWYGVVALPMITLFILPRASRQVMLTKENALSSSSRAYSETVASTPDAGKSTGQGQEVEMTEEKNGDQKETDSTQWIDTTEDRAEGSQDQETKQSDSPKSQSTYEDGYVVKDDEFGTWFLNVFEHMNDYDGKTVTLKAQVYHDESLQNNEMVAVRGIMTCCIADLQYYGYVCRGEGLGDLPDNSWVWVTGTLHVEDYLGTVEPTILVTDISQAEAPDVEYSYFY